MSPLARMFDNFSVFDDFSVHDPPLGGDLWSEGSEILDHPLHASINGDEVLFSSSTESFIRSFLEAP